MSASARRLLDDLALRFPARDGAFQLLASADCALHDTDGLTPEVPGRLDACLRGLLALPADAPVAVARPAPAHWRDLAGTHEAGYLQALESTLLAHRAQFMSHDCPLAEGSAEAILAAAGLALALGDLLARGGAGFALTRPPGHHAGPGKAEGFCFLNNVVLAVHRLRLAHPGARIAVLDPDLHHGNGTQDFLARMPGAFFLSLHGEPKALYPHRGSAEENQDAPGIVRNFPLAEGAGPEPWLRAWRAGLCEAEAFAPDFVLVSLGLDAHAQDPFGLFALDDDAFVAALREARALADRTARGRLGLVLEGGYSERVLERLVPRLVAALAAPRPGRAA